MHTVGDLMTRVVVTANADDVVGPIRDLMIRNGIHCVPVLGTDETLLGIITSTDLIEEWAPQMGVETVMTRAVETVSPHQSIVDAAHTMIDRRIHHLVVTERDRVVGVVSALDHRGAGNGALPTTRASRRRARGARRTRRRSRSPGSDRGGARTRRRTALRRPLDRRSRRSSAPLLPFYRRPHRSTTNVVTRARAAPGVTDDG
jgi:hypothetical protein